MIKFIQIIVVLFFTVNLSAQELNCLVTVNSDKIRGSNKQLFTTLQKSISEYVNNTKWTNRTYSEKEKIKCALTFFITKESGSNTFSGNLQIQVSRPVFNSTYQTSIFNYKDNNLTFNYAEFEPFIYNPNSFDSNLVSILTFYSYTIIGLEADTFKINSGDPYFKQAENVVNQAQQSGFLGWNRIDGKNTRYQLNENSLSSAYQNFLDALYIYHRNGLDEMYSNKLKAKQAIFTAIKKLYELNNSRPNAFLIRVFLDAKADEIVDVFSNGPYFDNSDLIEMLQKISPINNEKWQHLR